MGLSRSSGVGGGGGFLVRALYPGVFEELLDGESLFRIHGEEMRDQILG